MRKVPSAFGAAIFVFCFVSLALAQDAVPSEMLLQRTFSIKAGQQQGTAFSIDYEGKIYLVTARHVAKGLPASNATIQVRRSGGWEDRHTLRTLFPPSDDADIAVLETDETISRPFQVTTMGATGGSLTMGQQVWFLGYPFSEGLGSRMSDGTIMPFMKRGTMSAIDASRPDAVVLYIDGFNNPGFSGGPIIFWNFSSHTYQVAGVVQGYRYEAAKALVNGVQVDTDVLVNSGILVAYSIRHAIQAIEKGASQK